ncbi:2-dehydro-3-deoxygalactonokinase [Sphingomonas morindae]|uniref:2-dehydro-3-deoxygalactonokinase n=1 Tax=Sphingomonas morindae TaxID=1541170 RepID=A0ABY4XC18_9SPHN|nr:2-dehydro-3-deoxygalactonokinase [Sphingomonas morindae]USI74503.1 2-dehydro-3-deoxygalactonokinase [Sphingomonas morindae]
MMRYTIVGDWGTSRLRLFRLEAGAVTDRRDGPGIAALPDTPEAVLRAAIAPWRDDGPPASISLCGMIGSRNGWRDVPYVACPADAAAWAAGAARLDFDGSEVAIMPGLACADARGVPDVMRGEETQIFGAMALDPALGRGRHRIALPGTHGKWAEVEDGAVRGFRTYLTGELFALLRDHSTLARAGAGPAEAPDEAVAAERAGFAAGLAEAEATPLAGALFQTRSRQLREARSQAWALGFLSGLVIGAEVAAATAEPQAGAVMLIGDPALAGRYAEALARRGLATHLGDGDACARAGLALWESLT